MQSEIYKRMHYVNREACLSEKNIHKSAEYVFANTSFCRKDSPWSRNTLTLQ